MAKRRTNRTPKKRASPQRKRSAPDWAPAFLAALAETSNVSEACKAVKIGRRTFYDRRDGDQEFADAVRDALDVGCDALEREARRRGFEGYHAPVIYKGELAGTWILDGQVVAKDTPGAKLEPLTVRKFSDVLLLALLNAHRPEKFRHNHKHEVSGIGGKPIALVVETIVTTREQADAVLAASPDTRPLS